MRMICEVTAMAKASICHEDDLSTKWSLRWLDPTSWIQDVKDILAIKAHRTGELAKDFQACRDESEVL